MISQPQISVCVCTFRRPHLLAALLASLAAQTFPREQMEVVIVDNDKAGSGREVVDAAREQWPDLVLHYAVEPEPGISYARNRTLALAKGTYLAFIDDDEQACPNWLTDMIDTLSSNAADAVLGPVIPVFPPGSKTWAEPCRFFERPRFATGAFLGRDEGRTCNAMVIAVLACSRQPEVFATVLARSGGEDHDFFKWLVQQGGRMVWCDSAEVREEVPLARQSLSFVLERSFRTSVTYWRGEFAEHGLAWSAFRTAQGIMGGGLCLCFGGVIFCAGGLAKAIPVWSRAFRAFGRLGALLALKPVGYGDKR